MTTRYSLGFCFNASRSKVVLIEKLKPEWQKGRLNGVGGKVEPNETPYQAMVREFLEEAGVSTVEDNWNYFACMHGTNWQKHLLGNSLAEVRCFETVSQYIFDRVFSVTEENIIRIDIDEIICQKVRVIPNLSILISLALSTEFQRPIDLIWSAETLERVRQGGKK